MPFFFLQKPLGFTLLGIKSSSIKTFENTRVALELKNLWQAYKKSRFAAVWTYGFGCRGPKAAILIFI